MEHEELTLEFTWKQKLSGIVKAIVSKKRNVGGITIPDFKLYYRAIAIKRVWYWHKKQI
jgi:hypothetical protein